MLHINDLTYRIGRAPAARRCDALPSRPATRSGWSAATASARSTLLRLILGELQSESGSIGVPRHARIGTVAQEAPGGAKA